jgi:hypothetical protein
MLLCTNYVNVPPKQVENLFQLIFNSLELYFGCTCGVEVAAKIHVVLRLKAYISI